MAEVSHDVLYVVIGRCAPLLLRRDALLWLLLLLSFAASPLVVRWDLPGMCLSVYAPV